MSAVIGAMRGGAVLAGVLLGLAIANKEWGVLAIGPVLVALDHGRLRAVISAAGVAALLLAPFMLAGGHFAGVHGASATGATFQRWQLWWFFGSSGRALPGIHDAVGYRSSPHWVQTMAHPLIVALMLLLTAVLVAVRSLRRARKTSSDGLLLLSLLLLLRCVLDPWDLSYYSLPFLLALLAWETLAHQRAPVLASAATFAAWIVFEETLQPACTSRRTCNRSSFSLSRSPRSWQSRWRSTRPA